MRARERSRIQLCGRLSIELDGVERAGALRGRQVPLLFAYLILARDRLVGREELIGALWPDRAPRDEDASLRVLLSRLRSGLGGAALDGRDELTLVLPEPVWVDVEAASAEVGRAREALARGDAKGAWALAQVPLNIASRGLMPGAQAPWLEARRRDLGDVRLAALELIGRAGLVLGGTQLASVERAARALIESEPYRETGYVLLMEALEAQGNVAEAVRVFDRLRALLREELGTTPSPDAIAMSERLLVPGSTSRPPAPSSTGPLAIPLPEELRAQAEGPVVGRQQELEALERWLGRAWRGETGAPGGRERVLLLAGDPGVGKTRLLAETAKRAHAAGTIVMAGRAPEESLVAFQPLLEALGHYVACAPAGELRSVAREHGSELSRLLPELRRRLPDLPAPGAGDPQTERYRLFEAVVGLLGAISALAPVLIVLDDLHWADRPSLQLLRHLARAPGPKRVSILGAYRASEGWSEGFADALAGLRHDRLMVQLDVGGLPAQAAERLVELRLGEPAAPALVRALWAETGGNPFFIEEIVRHLADSGVSLRDGTPEDLRRVGLPPDVRDVISRRLQRLSADAREWLRVAAVIGRDFEVQLLERVLAFEEERFLAALDECLAQGLIAEAPGAADRYQFVHALIRETLYDGTSGPRRARLHRRVALALRDGWTGTDSAERLNALALHFARGAERDDSEPAIGYALRAAEQATASVAHEQAAGHYARALELLERFAPEDERRRLDVLLALGEAQVKSGQRPGAWRTFREAAELADRLGDAAAVVRAAIGASRRYVHPPGVVDHGLIDLLERALAHTEGERSLNRVVLLARMCGAIYYSAEHRVRMEELSEQATVLAAELGDAQARAVAAAARRRAHWGPGQLERRLADSTELLRAAREAGDLELTLQGHAWLVTDLLESGDLTGVDAQIEAFTTGAQQLRQPLYMWNAVAWQTMRATLAGRLEEAERLSDRARQSGVRAEDAIVSRTQWIQLLAIRREQLRAGELEAATRQLVAAHPDRRAWRAALGLLLAQLGRPEQARAELERLAEREFADIPPDNDWLATIALAAELASELQDALRARVLSRLLEPHAHLVVIQGVGIVVDGPVARFLGRLAATLSEPERARSHLEAAIERGRALRAPALVAHAQLDLASAVGGAALVEEAQAAAERLGLAFVARRAERLRAVG